MRTSYYFFCLIISTVFFSVPSFTQTINFDETWKEFLENDKISNMSALVKPDKRYDLPDYAKYLLMNTNNSFCQSEMGEAEGLMAEIQAMDPELHEAIPGFVGKKEELEAKMEAYYSMDEIWKRFLQTRDVEEEELEAVQAAKASCEKKTLAKYSYMTAYYHLCQGSVSIARNIFENRTLRLAEKTSLRVEDVEGLAEEVAKMKSLFQDMSKLDVAWNTYIETGVSPGFDIELPLFPCYPIPNMKEAVLKGMVDLCNSAPVMLEKIKALQAESGVVPDGELEEKVKELEAAIAQKESDLSVLNEVWEAFIPDNKVIHTDYGYEYCSTEPLIRAYILDAFSYVCEFAEEVLEKIDSLERAERLELDEITRTKINELAALYEKYQFNGMKIEHLWNEFVANDDTLLEDYQSTNLYCDNIHQVKDWTILGLSGTCEEGYQYLDQIEDFQRTFEFDFTEDLECRVQNLRIKVWDCRYALLSELAGVEASPDSYEERLKALMDEYGMEERPEACILNE